METIILKTWNDMRDFRSYVESNDFPYLVIDTETDSVIEKTANLYGVGLCFEEDQGFYIPIRMQDETSWWTPEQEEKIATWITTLCQKKKLIGHNIIYDVLVLQSNWGVDLAPHIYSDTILQKHAVDEERPFGLKEVAVKYLGEWADKAQQTLYANIAKNGGRTTKEHMEMFKADTDVLGEYCAWDVMLTRKLFNIFEERLIKENLVDLFYKEEIMPLYREVTIPMKQRGFTVDVPYFEQLNQNISKDIAELKLQVQREIAHLVVPFEKDFLMKEYPPKTGGKFPIACADLIGFDLPVTKDGRVTLSQAALKKLPTPANLQHQEFLSWLRGERELDADLIFRTQSKRYYEDNPESGSIFNISSVHHLKWLFFEELHEEPLSKTDKGEPQVDEDFLDSVAEKHPWVQTLNDYKKLLKLKSTYIEGVLDRHIDGVVYSTFVQFGPPSGRYASKDPNLQNLPRVKEDDSGLSELVLKYVNSIKVGFVAPAGYKIVNADYSQLEPCAFSEACGDKKLQEVFIKKQDLYSSIAINVWGLHDASADKKASNYLKNLYPEYRQKAKIIALAVVYGAEASRIANLMGIEYEEAQEVIDNYLNAYPGLKSYMSECNKIVCTTGAVKTKFGRTRHLPLAKELYGRYGMRLLDKKWAKKQGLSEVAWKFKNMLNLAKNYRIQGVAAHVVNRAAIAISKEFKRRGLDAQLVAQVHDELTCIAREDQAEEAKAIVKHCMENTTKIAVPLVAEPLIGSNWAESK